MIASETWRDPLVIKDPGGDGWHLLITARAVDAARNDDGVIAHARSAALASWELGPPLCEPHAGFGQLEVPQVGVWSFEIMDPIPVRVVDGVLVAAEDCQTVITTPAHHLAP